MTQEIAVTAILVLFSNARQRPVTVNAELAPMFPLFAYH